jgi:hypothetical protein
MGEPSNDVELIVRCDCDYEARGAEQTLVSGVQEDGRKAHNIEVTREQVLAMARRPERRAATGLGDRGARSGGGLLLSEVERVP